MTPGLSRAERTALRRALGLLHLNSRRVAAAVAAGSAALGSGVALAAVSAWLIARASQMPPVLDLTIAVVSVRALGISRAVFRYVERLVSHDVALRGMTELRAGLYARLADGALDSISGLRKGDVLARTGADVDTVGDLVVRALLPGAVSALVGIGSVLLVATFLPSAAIVLLAGLLAAGVLAPWLALRATRRAETAGLAERAELAALSLTAVEAASELQVSGRTADLLGDVAAADRRLEREIDRAARPGAFGATVNLLAMAATLLGSLLLAIPATTAGLLAPVELAVVVLLPLAAFEATAMLPAAAGQLARSAGAAVRLVELVDAAGEPTPARPAAAAADAPPAVGAGLEARDLVCGRRDRAPALVDVELTLSPGESLAVVGPSGSGKSTLLLTLAGLIPPLAGRVRVGGREPWGTDRAEISEQVVFTAEDAHLFDTSVLENLRVARADVTAEEAADALAAVGLGDWLAHQPRGLDSRLGPDGSTVSGGERRRLLLARALLTRAPVLLVDEPAEHLDPPSADRLVADLLRAARERGRGVVVVTHRLTPLAAADQVLVLGRPPGVGAGFTVVARGTHAQVVEASADYRWALMQERAGSPERQTEPGTGAR